MNIEPYLLTLLVFSPLAGILLLFFINKEQERLIKIIGLCSTLVPLLLSFYLLSLFDFAQQGYQLAQSVAWVTIYLPVGAEPFMQFHYELGVDGLSVALVLLTTIVTAVAAWASLSIKKRWKEYFILFLLLEIGMIGVFVSMNLLLFFIFFEVTIIAMFLLVSIWGYANREKAALSFLIYNGIGSAAMLIVFVVLLVATGTLNFEELSFALSNANWISQTLPMAMFLGLLFAFGVKLPIFPLHSWMLKVHVQAHPAIVMIHSGILLKLGAYGLIRFGMGLFPEQLHELSFYLGVLGVISILYGAILAFVQKDLKLVLAYSSISHMGLILLGIVAMNESGVQGAIFQAVSHGLISALLFFMILVIYERTKTTMIAELGGLAKTMPLVCGVLLTAAMANLGLPGMSGFISELLVFVGIFERYPWVAAVGMLGIILTAAYLLRAVLNATFGPAKEKWAELADIKRVEVIPIVILLGLIILIGVYPSVLGDTIQLSVENIVHSLLARIGG